MFTDILRTAALAAAFITFLSPVASAGRLWAEPQFNWIVGAYSDDQDNSFQTCMATAEYNSGIRLNFIVNRSLSWSMGLGNSSWHLQKGSNYSLSYSVDGSTPKSAMGIAVGEDYLVVALPNDAQLLDAMRRGNSLTVETAQARVSFDLNKTAYILGYLFECAQHRGEKASANLFGPASPNSPPPSHLSKRDGYRAEAAAILANVLSTAGVTSFKFMSPTDLDRLKVPGDAAWTMEGFFGAVQVNDGVTLEAEEKVLRGSDAQNCKGKFASGVNPTSSQNVKSLFTVCSNDGNTFSLINYTIVPRKAGGNYTFAVVGLNATPSEEVKKLDNNIRGAALNLSN